MQLGQLVGRGLTVAVLLCARSAYACTAVCVAKSASVDGVALTSHSNDCPECDNRLALVPGRTHKTGDKHLVYGLGAVYPRAHNNRSVVYQNSPDTPVLAYIDEVETTYGIWENTYPLINEVGLTMAESTCDSKVSAAGIDQPDPATGKFGEAKLSITMLMQLGLERCDTVACAIKTMGSLAEEHGFYGEGFMTGEALALADTTGEAWMFHIVQDYTTKISAVWIAQRVPDNHVAVVANAFTIQEVPYVAPEALDTRADGFLHSANMYQEARSAGLWKGMEGRDKFSFQRVFGSESKPMYATVRMQWIYTNVAPSLGLKVEHHVYKMPFSVPVDSPITVRELMTIYQSHYEQTDHDMTRGVLAGPFSNPHRVSGVDGDVKQKNAIQGQTTRGIGVPYTAYTHIGYAHPTRGASFFALDEPANSVFVPLLTATLVEAREAGSLSETGKLYAYAYQIGTRFELDLDSAWWAFDIVSNWMNQNYGRMRRELVKPATQRWQDLMMEAHDAGTTEAATSAQESVVNYWKELFQTLVVRYNDGILNYAPGYDPRMPVADIGYPAEFLEEIGYDNTFWLTKSFSARCNDMEKKHASPWVATASTVLLALVAGFVVGWVVNGRRRSPSTAEERRALF
ncbi:hypothetical protein SARC_00572 [Sphaeroforma arctica JP610]|uniref:Dipeptidase n=1 Tax=Sphaeroforma arctica JP610 TaxID=667725 RepID=A0A0L0GEM0_9EUKA|nr:hypothetical protein SARC_00572 [Sphaeroforma arctica JP610]KNC87331.1 hypothetical protein SARC_00572 [Sphaeroforma arctica JP610]|eukprot:XP_014161233.1 hypothetical protein SARC_00572 [Sphaeroforma arctica JP610]